MPINEKPGEARAFLLFGADEHPNFVKRLTNSRGKAALSS
jgi:hypothetical protein